MTALRSPIDSDEPTTVCTSVVSVVRREHFAGLRGFKKLRALLQHMGVHGIAQVGSDALAQPAHQVKAPRQKLPTPLQWPAAGQSAGAVPAWAAPALSALPAPALPAPRPVSISVRSAHGKASVASAASSKNNPATAIRQR